MGKKIERSVIALKLKRQANHREQNTRVYFLSLISICVAHSM